MIVATDPQLLQNPNNDSFHCVPHHCQAAEPKKASPAPPAAAEAAQTAKAKEEPKAAGKTAEAGADHKPVSGAPQSGDDTPKKLEKRNSFQNFFKNLVGRTFYIPLC